MDDMISTGELLLQKKKSIIPTVILYILILLLTGMILFFYLIGSAIVDGPSMDTTLYSGQRVLLLKHGYDVSRGDIVTFTVNENDLSKMLIKRIIGLPGDKILFVRTSDGSHVDMYMCENGQNSYKLIDEPYINGKMMYDKAYFPKDFSVMPYVDREEIENSDIASTTSILITTMEKFSTTVSAGCFYFLGDNRNRSTDSRKYGESEQSKIVGKVIALAQPDSALEGFINFFFPIK